MEVTSAFCRLAWQGQVAHPRVKGGMTSSARARSMIPNGRTLDAQNLLLLALLPLLATRIACVCGCFPAAGGQGSAEARQRMRVGEEGHDGWLVRLGASGFDPSPSPAKTVVVSANRR